MRHEQTPGQSRADDTRNVRPKRFEREVDSIGDLSSNFSRIDGKAPMFFDGSEMAEVQRERVRKNLQNISSIEPSPLPKALLLEDREFSDKQTLRREIRAVEDDVIALKKLYREKLEARVSLPVTQDLITDPALLSQHRMALTQIASEIELKSDALLKKRKRLREADTPN
jgi:hypothetical protein